MSPECLCAPADGQGGTKAVPDWHHEVQEHECDLVAAVAQIGQQALPPIGGLNHIQFQLQAGGEGGLVGWVAAAARLKW